MSIPVRVGKSAAIQVQDRHGRRQRRERPSIEMENFFQNFQ